MRGYRRGTRAFGLGCLIVIAILSVWTAGDSRGGRYEWEPPLIFGVLACVVLRFAVRPRVRLTSDHLLLDEPGWRWVVPTSVVTAVESEGRLIVRTQRRGLEPSAFAPSVIARLMGDGELQRTAQAIRAWWEPQRGVVRAERERRCFRSLIMDGVGCLVAAHVVYVVGLLVLS